MKAEECNPKELGSGQTSSQIELCVSYLFSGFRKVVCAYSLLPKGRSLSSCM